MATRTVADRPFRDLGVLDADEVVGGRIGPPGAEAVVSPAEEAFEEASDPLSPARGILLALLFASPFWIAVFYWLVW